MQILTGIVLGLVAWFVLRILLMGVYTVDQNERAVKTRFGRAVRVPGGKTTLDDPVSETLRQVHESSDFAPIAAMKSEVWDDDFSWVTQDLQSRVQAAPDEIVVLVAEADGGGSLGRGWWSISAPIFPLR